MTVKLITKCGCSREVQVDEPGIEVIVPVWESDGSWGTRAFALSETDGDDPLVYREKDA